MRGRGVTTASPALFPLSISGRYLVSPTGRAFVLVGDTPWSIAVQLTESQIDRYLDHRASVGVNAILFNAIEHYFSSQTPAYRNASGYDPFTAMTDFAAPNENYWRTIDYIANGCLSRGIACMMNPAYFGYTGGSQGWTSEITAETAGDLQTYGAWLARRYAQPNVVWCFGGDYVGDATLRAKQWNIVTGMRTVRTDQVITAHTARNDRPYSYWNGQTGFNLNNIYCGSDNITHDDAASAYAEGLPFFMIEGGYEGEAGSAATIRLAVYTSILSGACGHFFGNNPIWGFGEPIASGGGGPTAALNGSLHSTAAQSMVFARRLFDAYDISRLVPKTDASLVSSSLGTSGTTARICPALANDGSYALVWVPSSQTVTVVMSALKPASVRVRLYDASTGVFSTVGTYSNTGTQDVATGGERVIVLDGA